MRLWLRRRNQPPNKRYAIHEFNGTDTSCMAAQIKGMNLGNYDVTGVVHADEHVCSACQIAIAERRGRL